MISFEKIPDEYKNVGAEWAKSKAHYEFLDEEKKTVLARCASKIEWAESTRERLARQDEEFISHLNAVKQARGEYLWYETYLHALDMRFEWHRSQNATKRAEMKIL